MEVGFNHAWYLLLIVSCYIIRCIIINLFGEYMEETKINYDDIEIFLTKKLIMAHANKRQKSINEEQLYRIMLKFAKFLKRYAKI